MASPISSQLSSTSSHGNTAPNLRLANTFYLPSIVGRADAARADLRGLARLLPDAHGRKPDALHRVMVAFVLDNAPPAGG